MLRSIAASGIAGLAFAGLLFASPLSAEVVKSDERGFVTREVAVVEASPKQVWLTLISPAKWWNSGHTWSGDATNLTIKPQAGGCFCERIPEDPDPNRITLEGSVEHMRVVHAFPERALRMQGALGPLQSEAVTGVLTVALAQSEAGGTTIVWEYVVGGYMRYEVPIISKAVDGVMTQQLAGLTKLLGPVGEPVSAVEPMPAPQAEVKPAEEAPDSNAATDEKSDRERSLEEAVRDLLDG